MSDPHLHFRETDAAVVELLRGDTSLGIGELAEKLGVTATAVRQRLDRLMEAGVIDRRTVARPRGRPAHVYSLTEMGRRIGGDNFRDLAIVLWKELRRVTDSSVRQGLLQRVAASLADMYRDRVSGQTTAERLSEVATLLTERGVPCVVEQGALPMLVSHSCPYPVVSDQDRAICAAERLMLQELVGAAVQLSECRLDGAHCCRFTAANEPFSVQSAPQASGMRGLERTVSAPSNAASVDVS